MNIFGVETQIFHLDGAKLFVEFFVNWLLQSTILISVGLLLGRVLKPRGSAVQSLVYRATLVAVLACPVATLGMSAMGVSGWSLAMPESWRAVVANELDSSGVSSVFADGNVNEIDSRKVIGDSVIDESPSFEPSTLLTPNTGSAMEPSVKSFMEPRTTDETQVQIKEEASIETLPVEQGQALSFQWFGLVAAASLVAWMLISMLLLFRLGFAWWRLLKLKRTSIPAESSICAECARLSGKMQVDTPAIMCSPFLPSPCLAGLWRPTILIPERGFELSIQDLLVHELAHLRRRDCYWNLLRQMATAILFCQPLMWVLSRRIEISAEEVCDDFVVQFGGDRCQYANQLVDIAELASAPVAAAGVGVVSLRSMLAQRVLRIMDTSRTISTQASRWFLVSLVGCGISGTLITGMLGLQPGPNDSETQIVAKEPGNDTEKESKRYSGVVVDPDGKAVGGADLYLVFYVPESEGLLEPKWKPVSATNSNGEFDFTIDTSRKGYGEYNGGKLVAVKDGFGLAWHSASLFDASGESQARLQESLQDASDETKPRILKQLEQVGKPMALARDDHAISGKIVNIEGQPVAGAKLTLLEVWGGLDDDLTAWREEAVRPKADYYSALRKTSQNINGPQVRSLVRQVFTDEEGGFQVHGIGNGRIARLLLEGPGIASAKIFARTEPGQSIELLRSLRSRGLGTHTYYPKTFTYVAGPSAAITGVVRDADTKEPLVGVTVKSQARHGEKINGWGQDFVRAVTDKHGRFSLEGMPIGSDNRIAAIPPLGDIPYLPASRQTPTDSPQNPLDVQLELQRGVWVEGQFTDQQTGKGLSGWVNHQVSNENPNLGLARTMHVDMRDRQVADDDGRFKIAILPGHGYLTFLAHDHHNYPRSKFIVLQDGSHRSVNSNKFVDGTLGMIPSNSHLIAEINPEKGQGVVKFNYQLSGSGSGSLTARVVGPNGEPVNQYFYTGRITAMGGSWNRSNDGKLELISYDETQGRKVYIVSADHKLSGYVNLSGKQDLESEAVFKIQPAGSVKGRLLDQDGIPVAGCQLMHWRPSFASPAEFTYSRDAPPLPLNVQHSSSPWYETDDDGQFEIKGLVAGVEYRILARMGNPTDLPQLMGPLERIITTAKGEDLDLGDVKITDEASMLKLMEEAEKAKKSRKKISRQDPRSIFGLVVGHDRKPIAGAKIYWLVHHIDNLNHESARLVATSDKDGRYRFELPAIGSKEDPAIWNYRQWIVVRADGHGFRLMYPRQLKEQMQRLDTPSGSESELEGAIIGLPKVGNSIKGRVVDIDGQSVVGARVRIQWYHNPNQHRPADELADYDKYSDQDWTKTIEDLNRIIEPSQAIDAFPQAITDGDGRFELKGLGPSQIFKLVIDGDNIERAIITARNVPGQKIKVTSDYLAKGEPFFVHPNELVHVAGPSNPVAGQVVDFDTGDAISNALILVTTIHGYRRPMRDRRYLYSARTNELGQFEIKSLPVGSSNTLVCVCPNSKKPYPVLGQYVDTNDSAAAQTVRFRMKQGVWAEGRVYDSDTDNPMAGSISYYYFRNAELEKSHPGIRRAMLPRAYWTNLDGRFRIPVWPTRGILAYQHNPTTSEEAMKRPIDRYPRGAGADQIEGVMEPMSAFMTEPYVLMPGNYRRLAEINPDANQVSVHVDLPLSAAHSVFAQVVWPKGIGGNEFRVYGANKNWGWERHVDSFEIRGIKNGEQRSVYVFHRESNLIAKITVGDHDSNVEISEFQSAGSISGRLVDADGEPVTDVTLGWNYQAAEKNETGIWAPHPGKMRSPTAVPTDAEGKFKLTGIVPGLEYSAEVTGWRKMNAEWMPTSLGTIFTQVDVKPGENKDLGVLVLGGNKSFRSE